MHDSLSSRRKRNVKEKCHSSVITARISSANKREKTAREHWIQLASGSEGWLILLVRGGNDLNKGFQSVFPVIVFY